MKLFKNKKAIILIFLLAIYIIFFEMTSLYIKIDSNRGVFSAKVGEPQFKILDAYNEVQADLFYIDQSAKYAAYNALNNLEQRGGFSQEFPCGQLEGYVIWRNKDKDCFPTQDTVIDSFIKAINLDRFLEVKGLQKENYEYYISIQNDKFRFVGTALKNIEKKISLNNNDIGVYSVKPSFDVLINYNLGIFEQLRNIFSSSGILLNISQCETKKDITTCIKEEFERFNKNNSIKLELDCENKGQKSARTFFICASTEKRYLSPYDGFTERQQKVKFAIYLPQKIEQTGDISYVSSPDGCVILSWKKPDKKTDYSLYYAESDVAGKTIGDDGTVQGAKSKIISVDNAKDNTYDYFNTVCSFESISTPCLYQWRTPSNSGTLSFSQGLLIADTNNYYFKTCDITPSGYFFSLVPKNKASKAIESSVKIAPSDRMVPGKVEFTANYNQDTKIIELTIIKIDKILDNTYANDFKEYFVFLSDTKDNLVDFKNLQPTQIQDSIITLQKQYPAGIYFVGVIAVDNNDNPFKKIAATAEKEGSLLIQPEYSKVINDLANPQAITIT